MNGSHHATGYAEIVGRGGGGGRQHYGGRMQQQMMQQMQPSYGGDGGEPMNPFFGTGGWYDHGHGWHRDGYGTWWHPEHGWRPSPPEAIYAGYATGEDCPPDYARTSTGTCAPLAHCPPGYAKTSTGKCAPLAHRADTSFGTAGWYDHGHGWHHDGFGTWWHPERGFLWRGGEVDLYAAGQIAQALQSVKSAQSVCAPKFGVGPNQSPSSLPSATYTAYMACLQQPKASSTKSQRPAVRRTPVRAHQAGRPVRRHGAGGYATGGFDLGKAIGSIATAAAVAAPQIAAAIPQIRAAFASSGAVTPAHVPVSVNPVWADASHVLAEAATQLRASTPYDVQTTFHTASLVDRLATIAQGLALAPNAAMEADFHGLGHWLSTHPHSQQLAEFITTHPALTSVFGH